MLGRAQTRDCALNGVSPRRTGPVVVRLAGILPVWRLNVNLRQLSSPREGVLSVLLLVLDREWRSRTASRARRGERGAGP